MPGVLGQPGDGDRSGRRATQSANTSGRHRPPGCLDVARGTHLGQRPGAASQTGHMPAFEPPPTSRPIRLNSAGSSKTITKPRRSMMDHHANSGLGLPASPDMARWLAALKDAPRRASARRPHDGARRSLTGSQPTRQRGLRPGQENGAPAEHENTGLAMKRQDNPRATRQRYPDISARHRHMFVPPT